MSKITIKQIREKYLSSKEKEKAFKWTYHVRRPISYYMALPFFRMGTSASTVTMLWLLIAGIGCVFLASGAYYNMIFGAALLELAVILDCVDGHIARFTRQTRTGDILDTWVGEILLVSSFFSIGIGVANSPDPIVTSMIIPFLGDKMFFIYLGFFGALATLSSWTVQLHWRTIAMKSSSSGTELNHRTKNSRMSLIVENLFNYMGGLMMLILISAIFRVLDVTLILMSIVYGGYLIAMMGRVIRKAQILDRTDLEK